MEILVGIIVFIAQAIIVWFAGYGFEAWKYNRRKK